MPESDSRKNGERTPVPALPPDPDYLEVDEVLRHELALLRNHTPIESSSPPAKWQLFTLARKPENEEVSPALAKELFRAMIPDLTGIAGHGISGSDRSARGDAADTSPDGWLFQSASTVQMFRGGKLVSLAW